MDDVLEDDASEGRGSDTGEDRGDDEAGLYIDLSSLNKAELRELCDTRRISSEGLKKDLVARLTESRAEAPRPTPAIESADDPPESAPPSDHPSAPGLAQGRGEHDVGERLR